MQLVLSLPGPLLRRGCHHRVQTGTVIAQIAHRLYPVANIKGTD